MPVLRQWREQSRCGQQAAGSARAGAWPREALQVAQLLLLLLLLVAPDAAARKGGEKYQLQAIHQPQKQQVGRKATPLRQTSRRRQQQQQEARFEVPPSLVESLTAVGSADVLLEFAPERFYNPSLTVYPHVGGQQSGREEEDHEGLVWCAIKHTKHRKTKSKMWWINSIQLCRGRLAGLQTLRCVTFQPWGSPSRLDECEVDGRVRGGRTDSKGVGDTKLWVWPGKGVYAIFGHKPNKSLLAPPDEATARDGAASEVGAGDLASGGAGGAPSPQWLSSLRKHTRAHPALRPVHASADTQRFCSMQLVYHQWLVQVWSDPRQAAGDPWRLEGLEPLPLLPAPWLHAYPPSQPYAMEKNWMPWVYQEPPQPGEEGPAPPRERLMVSYLVMPHTVWELLPNGTALPRWSSPSLDPALDAKFAGFSVHGGPPVVWVPPQLQPAGVGGQVRGAQGGYYLGVMHHIERWRRGRLYRHFAFKFEAQPPFRITAISDELPLVYSGAKSKVAFVTGLHLDARAGLLYVSYGSADLVSRLLVLNMASLEALFSGQVHFRHLPGVNATDAYTLPGSGHGNGGRGATRKSGAAAEGAEDEDAKRRQRDVHLTRQAQP